MKDKIEIDGREGEGGGQIVRTSCALAALTGQPFRIIRIRARRKKPGLQAQHLTAVKAIASLCQADISGARLNAERFTFVPGDIRGGTYEFEVPTAGSACLVAQAILPLLVCASEPSEITLRGGTHVPMAPTFEFLNYAFVPTLRQMGIELSIRLVRPGFYPKGRGELQLRVAPWKQPQPFIRVEPPQEYDRVAHLYVAHLPEHVEMRARRSLERRGISIAPKNHDVSPSFGPGMAINLLFLSTQAPEVISGIGEIGTPTEHVVDRVLEAATKFEAQKVPVGAYLADQILLYLCLGAGGSFRTTAPTQHFRTQIQTLNRFMNCKVHISEITPSDNIEVSVNGLRSSI